MDAMLAIHEIYFALSKRLEKIAPPPPPPHPVDVVVVVVEFSLHDSKEFHHIMLLLCMPASIHTAELCATYILDMQPGMT